MALSSEEVALIILVAVDAEQNRNPADVRGRRPLGVLTKQLIQRHHWQELDFLQGWGLVISEKLAEVQEHEGNFYPTLTNTGRAFIEEQQVNIYKAANRRPLFESRHWPYVILLVLMAIRFGLILWEAR